MDYFRFIWFSCVLVSFFIMPWWCVYAGVLWYVIYYSPGYEIIVLGFVADTLYGVRYTHTLIASALCMVVFIVRSRIRV